MDVMNKFFERVMIGSSALMVPTAAWSAIIGPNEQDQWYLLALTISEIAMAIAIVAGCILIGLDVADHEGYE
jgi:cytochrome bd-type quinol oxidase subunit 1